MEHSDCFDSTIKEVADSNALEHKEPLISVKIGEELLVGEKVKEEPFLSSHSDCFDSTMKEIAHSNAPEYIELSLPGIIKEELLFEGEIVKEEPFLDEFGDVEEGSGTVAQVKEERDLFSSFGTTKKELKLLHAEAPICQKFLLSETLKEELATGEGILKAEPYQDVFIEEEHLELSQSPAIWNETKDHMGLSSHLPLSGVNSSNDFIPNNKEYFRSLEDSRFPIVLLTPLNISDHKLSQSPAIWNETKDHMGLSSHLPLSGVNSSEDFIPNNKEHFRSLEDSRFPIVLLTPLNISDHKLSQSPAIWNETKDHMGLSSHLPLSGVNSSEDSIPNNKEYFRSLEDSRFPIVLLTPLNISDHKNVNTRLLNQDTSVKELQDSKMVSTNSKLVPVDKIKQFRCSYCDYECKRNSYLTAHMLIHSNTKQFKCSDCQYECKRKSNLKIHMLTHSYTKQFKCSDCQYECKQKSHLKTHMLTHSNTKQFKCSECQYECKQKSKLKIHVLTHSNTKQLKCSDCDYECKHKNSLKLHMLTHSNTKQFKCSECDCECKHKNSLKRHLLTHSYIKQFRCLDCKYECKRKSYMKIHMLTHSNTKQFKCSDCDYEYKHKNSLKLHMLTHSNIKQFRCSDCQYECKRKSYLKIHMLTHSNTKQFKCSDCDYECKYKNSLKLHMLTHSNIKQFRCSDCQYECKRKSYLKQHMLTHRKPPHQTPDH